MVGVTHATDILFRPETTHNIHIVYFAFCWNQWFADKQLTYDAAQSEDDRDVWIFYFIAQVDFRSKIFIVLLQVQAICVLVAKRQDVNQLYSLFVDEEEVRTQFKQLDSLFCQLQNYFDHLSTHVGNLRQRQLLLLQIIKALC